MPRTPLFKPKLVVLEKCLNHIILLAFCFRYKIMSPTCEGLGLSKHIYEAQVKLGGGGSGSKVAGLWADGKELLAMADASFPSVMVSFLILERSNQ